MFISAYICEKLVATWYFENEVMVGNLPSDGKLLLTEQDYRDREARWQAVCDKCYHDLRLKGYNSDVAQLQFSIKSRIQPVMVSEKEMHEFNTLLRSKGHSDKITFD